MNRKGMGIIGVLVLAMMTLVLPAIGQEESAPPNQCFEQVTEYQYQKQRVSGSGDVPANLAYWGPGGFQATSDAAGWFAMQADLIPPAEAAGAGYTGTLAINGIPTDTEFPFAGDTWIYDEVERLVTGDAVPCIEIAVSSECGVVYGSVTENRTPFGAGVRGVIGTDLPLLVNWQTESFSLNGADGRTFEEDEFGGSVVVTIFVVGPEQDYYAVNGVSAIFESITVDTDCEDPEPEPTTTTLPPPAESSTTLPPEESTTTTDPGEDTTTTTPDDSTTTTDPDDPDELPFTGINMGAMGAAGASGVLLGLLILLATRGKAVE